MEMRSKLPSPRGSPALALAVVLALVTSGPVSAAGANAEPESQTHNHGVASQWNLTWSGDPLFDYDFFYGDRWFLSVDNTAAVARNTSRTFWPCCEDGRMGSHTAIRCST